MSRSNQQDRDWREREERNRGGYESPGRNDQDYMYANEDGESRREDPWRRRQQGMGSEWNRGPMGRFSEQDQGYNREQNRGQQRFGSDRSYGQRGNYGYNSEGNQQSGQYGETRGGGQRSGQYDSENGFGAETQFGSGGSRGPSFRYEGTTSHWNQGQRQSRGQDDGQTTQGQFSGRGPRNYKRGDDRIEEDINERLTEHGSLDATEIEVSVQNGEVTLKGTVENRQAKRMAEEIAEAVSGVKDVTNQIKVQQSGTDSQQSGTNTQTSGKNQQRKAS